MKNVRCKCCGRTMPEGRLHEHIDRDLNCPGRKNMGWDFEEVD